MAVCSGTSTSSQASIPKSWSEDLKSYRDTRGCRSHSIVASKDDAPARYSRTSYVPFADTRHQLFPYNDFIDSPETTRSNPEVQADRWNRHGWGDVSLIKQDGYSGIPHPRASDNVRGKAMPEPSMGKDGRTNLFGTLQQTEVGCPDSWIGNAMVDPLRGKGTGPKHSAGNKAMFDVMGATNPGLPADDVWMGNSLIDPSKGKAKPMGPEQRRGRRDLQEIYNQSILRESKEQQHKLLQKGEDPLADGWIGHALVSYNHGKGEVQGVHGASLQGSTFREIPQGHSDMPRRHQKFVPPPDASSDTLFAGGAGGADEFGRRGRKEVCVPVGPTTLVRQDNLYSHMTYKPLASTEQTMLSKSYDDSKHYTKRHCPMPQAHGPGQGREMLHWRPEQRIASYVPFGGLAQERRTSRLVASADGADALLRR